MPGRRAKSGPGTGKLATVTCPGVAHSAWGEAGDLCVGAGRLRVKGGSPDKAWLGPRHSALRTDAQSQGCIGPSEPVGLSPDCSPRTPKATPAPGPPGQRRFLPSREGGTDPSLAPAPCPPPGVSYRQGLLAALRLPGGHPLRRPHRSGLEPVPVHHPPLPDVFAPQPPILVLSVSIFRHVGFLPGLGAGGLRSPGPVGSRGGVDQISMTVRT